MFNKYILSLIICFSIFTCFAEYNGIDNKNKSKLVEVLNNNYYSSIITMFNGKLEEKDYEYLREFILECDNPIKLNKIYYIIKRNMFLSDERIKNEDNAEIFALLCKKGAINLENGYFNIFAKGEFPKKAENIFINWFKFSPTETLASFLGKHHSSNKNGIDVLKSKLNYSDKLTVQAIKLALACRGNKKFIKSETTKMFKVLEKKLETIGNVSEPAQYAFSYYNEFLDGLFPRDITLEYFRILMYSKYQGFNFGDCKSAPPFYLVRYILNNFEIETSNFPYEPNREEAIKWWEKNKARIRKELPENLSFVDKKRSEKYFNFYKKRSFFILSDLLHKDLEIIKNKQNKIIKNLKNKQNKIIAKMPIKDIKSSLKLNEKTHLFEVSPPWFDDWFKECYQGINNLENLEKNMAQKLTDLKSKGELSFDCINSFEKLFLKKQKIKNEIILLENKYKKQIKDFHQFDD
jgi:hypothetical protein